MAQDFNQQGGGEYVDQDPDGRGELTQTLEPMDGRALVAIRESEINQQIATARRFPRDGIQRIGAEIAMMATESEEGAAECIYALPRGGKVITGPSVRFAEIVATNWGNSRFAAQVVDVTDNFVIAEAVFHDLQKNVEWRFRLPRRITDARGKRYGDDMIAVTSVAAMSIALRNAILKGVPKTVWGDAFAKVAAMTKGSFESVEKRRTHALDAFKKLGVPEDKVLGLLDKARASDIDPDDMVVLRGVLTAIKDGDSTVNAVFGNIASKTAGNGGRAPVGEHLQNGKDKANAAKPKPATSAATTTQPASPAESGSGGEAHGHDAGAGKNYSGGEADGGQAGGTQGADDGAGGGGSKDAGQGAHGAGVQVAGDGKNDGNAHLGADSGEADRPQARWAEFLDIEGWTEAEVEKLSNLAVALDKADTAVAITKVSGQFLEVFESGRPEIEQAFTKMVAQAQSWLRAVATKKKPGGSGSAAAKL